MAAIEMKLQPTLDSVRRARRLVRESLGRCAVDESVVDTVELLTSEIVTNAIVHGGGTCELAVEVEARTVRVELRDDNPALPVRRAPAPQAMSGRGLLIVDRLARRWGFEPCRDDGKRVWFEVARA